MSIFKRRPVVEPDVDDPERVVCPACQAVNRPSRARDAVTASVCHWCLKALPRDLLRPAFAAARVRQADEHAARVAEVRAKAAS